MSRILVLSVIVASLSTIVGCGASATHHSATPSSVNVADVRDEACWTPPEEVAMHIQRVDEGAGGRDRVRGEDAPRRLVSPEPPGAPRRRRRPRRDLLSSTTSERSAQPEERAVRSHAPFAARHRSEHRRDARDRGQLSLLRLDGLRHVGEVRLHDAGDRERRERTDEAQIHGADVVGAILIELRGPEVVGARDVLGAASMVRVHRHGDAGADDERGFA